MRAHLLVFDSTTIDQKTMKHAIDGFDAVVNWYAFFGNAMCLASEESAKTLSRQIRDLFQDLKFIVTTVNRSEKGGWMPKPVWSFLNAPQAADVEAA